jgi:hypothetical protein
VVLSAIVTISACHYSQSITSCPTAELIATGNLANASFAGRLDANSLVISRAALLKYYLQSKAHCLRLISDSLLKGRDPEGDTAILIAVILLAILDLFESGSMAWAFHIEGAKKLLRSGAMAAAQNWKSISHSLQYEVSM